MPGPVDVGAPIPSGVRHQPQRVPNHAAAGLGAPDDPGRHAICRSSGGGRMRRPEPYVAAVQANLRADTGPLGGGAVAPRLSTPRTAPLAGLSVREPVAVPHSRRRPTARPARRRLRSRFARRRIRADPGRRSNRTRFQWRSSRRHRRVGRRWRQARPAARACRRRWYCRISRISVPKRRR